MKLALFARALDRPDEACARFEQALAMNERIGAVPALLRTELAYAALLGQTSIDPARAASLRARARAAAGRIQMQKVELPYRAGRSAARPRTLAPAAPRRVFDHAAQPSDRALPAR